VSANAAAKIFALMVPPQVTQYGIRKLELYKDTLSIADFWTPPGSKLIAQDSFEPSRIS